MDFFENKHKIQRQINSSLTIKVKNLPANSKMSELNEMFQSFGKIDTLNTVYDVKKEQFECLVKFYSKEVVQNALTALNGAKLDQYELVAESMEKE